MAYFVIHQSEDDLRIERLDAAALLRRLNEGDWYGTDFLQKIESHDMHEWSAGDTLIIKGDIVVPKPVQVVKEWEL